ncbi:hypothetical protein [Streptomyces sp. NPDC020362]|uniref:hypothetical protein n=1 Tax=unclassified Streptomyces TaxID=2593676 RepID=UPI0033C9CAA1
MADVVLLAGDAEAHDLVHTVVRQGVDEGDVAAHRAVGEVHDGVEEFRRRHGDAVRTLGRGRQAAVASDLREGKSGSRRSAAG